MNPEISARIGKAIKAYESAGYPPKNFPPESINYPPASYWHEIQRVLNWNGLTVPSIESLSLLDLGGGSDPTNYATGDYDYDPSFVRYLAAMGAELVVNVDQGPKDRRIEDVYHHVQLELTLDPDFSLVNELTQRQLQGPFDIVFSSMLVDEGNPSPSLRHSPSRLKRRILEWAPQLLKPEGYLILKGGYEGYVLRDHELVNFENLNE